MTDAKVELVARAIGATLQDNSGYALKMHLSFDEQCRAARNVLAALEQSDAVMGEDVLFNPDDSAEDAALAKRIIASRAQDEPPKDGSVLLVQNAGGFGYPALVCWHEGLWCQVDYQGTLRTDAVALVSFDSWARATPIAPVQDDDAELPCDVHLPPATTITKGCKLSTLIHALELRGMAPVSQGKLEE